MSRTNTHRQATHKEIVAIHYTGYELEELFTDEQIVDILVIARLAVAGEFFHAKDFNPRYKPGQGMRQFFNTDNYIIGCEGRPAKLARYVIEKTHRQIAHKNQLPDNLQELSPAHVERIVEIARFKAIIAAIDIMFVEGEIWYDEGFGIWNVRQSTLDEYTEDRAFRKAIRVKLDKRPFHGHTDRWRKGGVQLA